MSGLPVAEAKMQSAAEWTCVFTSPFRFIPLSLIALSKNSWSVR